MAGRRCPSCNLLCSVEQGEPELTSEELNVDSRTQEGSVTADVRVVLNSACCGDEIAEANLQYEKDVELKHDHNTKQFGEPSYELEITAENNDRFEGKGRGQRHFYGADIEAKIKCSCGWETTCEGSVDEQASSFEELA